MYSRISSRILRDPRSLRRLRAEAFSVITATNTSLLVGLQDPRKEEIWSQFYARYHPLLVSFGHRLGLNRQDAEDAAQETLMAFATAYRQGKYDRDRGRLRTWLSAIASNKIRDIQRRRGRELARGEADATTAGISQLPDDHSMSEMWEAEWQRAVVRQCLAEVRAQVQPKTMRAFELVCLKDWPADRVAAELGMSRNAVYLAKSHVLAKMQETQRELEEIW
jgi:RNA polymerase sigma-70 factor (ECF subfamily)